MIRVKLAILSYAITVTFAIHISKWHGVPVGGAACKNDIDCQLNGLCVNGACHCDKAWVGGNCSILNLLPAKINRGFYNINSTWSSWGGSGDVDENETWHMFAAEMAGHCGLGVWGQNSRCVHATSTSVDGPYERQDVVLDAWCHGTTGAFDPMSKKWFVFHMGSGCLRGDYINNCVDGVTPKSTNTTPSSSDKPCESHHTLTTSSILVADSPNGPWSPATKIPNCANGEPYILRNGTFFVACPWGGHVDDPHCGNQNAFLQMYRAESWNSSFVKMPLTYVLAGNNFSKPCFNWEDQTIWMDKRGHFHTIMHAWRGQNNDYPLPGCSAHSQAGSFCTSLGGHAYSLDGMLWYISPIAPFNATVQYEDGTSVHYRARERPHVVLDHNGELAWLSNGVGAPGAGGNTGVRGADRTYTIFQSIATQ